MARETETENNEAFVETEETEQPVQQRAGSIRLRIDDSGKAEWDSLSEIKQTQLADAIANSPDALGAIINASPALAEKLIGSDSEQAEMLPQVTDSTVIGITKIVMGIESIAISASMVRHAELRKFAAPIFAANWGICVPKKEELEPIMEPAKRIIGKYIPAEWLEHQDFAVVAEHLGELMLRKYQLCVNALQDALANTAKQQKPQVVAAQPQTRTINEPQAEVVTQ